MTALKKPKSFKENLPRRPQEEQAKPSVRKGSHKAIVLSAIRDTLSWDQETLRELSKVQTRQLLALWIEPVCHDIRWLLAENLADINRRVVRETTPSEPVGILNQGALESAQQAPANTRYYRQTEDMYLLSAVLQSRLILNHPFSSGNKRTAYAAARILLYINGYLLSAPSTGEVVQLCLEIVYGDLEEEQIAFWISINAEPYDPQQEAIHADSWLDLLPSQLDESSRE